MPNKLLLYIFFTYLILGNIPRVLPFTFGFGNINIIEVVLYVLVLVSLFKIPFQKKNIFIKPSIFHGSILLLIFSLHVGVINFGLDSTGIAYNIRLITMIVVGMLLGNILFNSSFKEPTLFIKCLVSLYAVTASLSILIYLLFPDSSALWLALEGIGVEIKGDPHIGRLVSVYFDPNLYSTIAVFPFMLSIIHWSDGYSFRRLILSLVILTSILLAISRSGMLLLFLSFIIYGNMFLLRKMQINKINRKVFIGLITLGISIILLIIANYEAVEAIYTRLVNTSLEDGSTFARLDTFNAGLSLIDSRPFFGYGYNFSLSELNENGLNGLDSGLVTSIASFGIVPFLIFILFSVYKICQLHIKIKRKKSSSPFLYRVWFVMITHILLVVLIIGNFNLIVFYPFWIIPVSAIYFYIEQHASISV